MRSGSPAATMSPPVPGTDRTPRRRSKRSCHASGTRVCRFGAWHQCDTLEARGGYASAAEVGGVDPRPALALERAAAGADADVAEVGVEQQRAVRRAVEPRVDGAGRGGPTARAPGQRLADHAGVDVPREPLRRRAVREV